MADIQMCDGKDLDGLFICPLRDTCHRFTAVVTEHWQAYGPFPYDHNTDTCDMFYPNEGHEKRDECRN